MTKSPAPSAISTRSSAPSPTGSTRRCSTRGSGRLRVVGNIGVGYDNIDVSAATRLGVAVCNTPGVLDETTADLAFLLLLAASRRATEAEATLRTGEWHGFRVDAFLGNDVFGAALGIVGFGRIGQAMARRATGFGMTVLHHCRRDTGLAGYVSDLDDLLARADAVSLHVPLTSATRHLIDERRLRLMQPHAVLVNTSRGPVVDEPALASALERGVIFGAGIDVYEREPEVHPACSPHRTQCCFPTSAARRKAPAAAWHTLRARERWTCSPGAGRPTSSVSSAAAPGHLGNADGVAERIAQPEVDPVRRAPRAAR